MGEQPGEFEQALARKIGPVLRRLYPQNPDVVLDREARIIAEAIAPEVMGVHDPTGEDHMREMWEHAQRADEAEAENELLRERAERAEWALLHPTTLDAVRLRVALTTTSGEDQE